MRTSLIVFGIIFLVVGGLLYYYPSQTVGAQTTGSGGEGSNVTATFDTPLPWAIALSVIGFLLLLFGLIIPGPVRVVQGQRGPRGRGSAAVKFIQGPRGPRGRRGPARHRRAPIRSKRAALPRGTSITTTTRIKR